jgi:hypothetical protein
MVPILLRLFHKDMFVVRLRQAKKKLGVIFPVGARIGTHSHRR